MAILSDLLLPSGFCLFCFGGPSAAFGYSGACPECGGVSRIREVEDLLRELEDEVNRLTEENSALSGQLPATKGRL